MTMVEGSRHQGLQDLLKLDLLVVANKAASLSEALIAQWMHDAIEVELAVASWVPEDSQLVRDTLFSHPKVTPPFSKRLRAS